MLAHPHAYRSTHPPIHVTRAPIVARVHSLSLRGERKAVRPFDCPSHTAWSWPLAARVRPSDRHYRPSIQPPVTVSLCLSVRPSPSLSIPPPFLPSFSSSSVNVRQPIRTFFSTFLLSVHLTVRLFALRCPPSIYPLPPPPPSPASPPSPPSTPSPRPLSPPLPSFPLAARLSSHGRMRWSRPLSTAACGGRDRSRQTNSTAASSSNISLSSKLDLVSNTGRAAPRRGRICHHKKAFVLPSPPADARRPPTHTEPSTGQLALRIGQALDIRRPTCAAARLRPAVSCLMPEAPFAPSWRERRPSAKFGGATSVRRPAVGVTRCRTPSPLSA